MLPKGHKRRHKGQKMGSNSKPGPVLMLELSVW